MRKVVLVVLLAILGLVLGQSTAKAQTPAVLEYQCYFISIWMFENIIVIKIDVPSDEGTTALKVGPQDQDQDQDRLRLQSCDQTCDCGCDCECDGSQKGRPGD